tara:strand:+ start:93 stop:692 length:600 start_codon:yes stop_codon:yes gene_type:complete
MTLIDFLKTSFQNVRSSKRTDDLHIALLNDVKNNNPQWKDLDWKYEYKLPIDAFGGTFDIDIAGFNDKNELKVCILAKAINSNVNKNIKNYANTTIGEAARLALAPYQQLEKIMFVSLYPRVAPRFKKSGLVEGFDDVVSAKNRTNIKRVIDKQYGKLVEVIDIFFDIVDVRKKTNKDEFNNILVENFQDKMLVTSKLT